ncbi:MAG: PEP-CTERM sorting domain-containing protein [Planctomycetota bacterium]
MLCFAFATGVSGIAAEVLVVDSLQERVLLVDAFDGSIINENFIRDDTRMQTPVNAINSGRGTIFISDALSDAVFEYGRDGSFIRTVVGSDSVDNVRGIAVHQNSLYMTIGAGDLRGTIQRFDLATGQQSTFIGSNLESPWDITFRDTDILISDSGLDDILRFDQDGSFLGTFVDGDSISPSLQFPQQINQRDNGNLLVGGFSLPTNLYEFDEDGNFIDTLAPGLGVRAGIELGTGEYLFSAGTRLSAVNPENGEIRTIVNDLNSNFRFLERDVVRVVPEPASGLAMLISAIAAMVYRRRWVKPYPKVEVGS